MFHADNKPQNLRLIIRKTVYFLYEKQDRDYLCVWKRVSIPLYILFPLQYCILYPFPLAILHDGPVPIIVGTMTTYVNFLFEIKTQPGVLLRPKRQPLCENGI